MATEVHITQMNLKQTKQIDCYLRGNATVMIESETLTSS